MAKLEGANTDISGGGDIVRLGGLTAQSIIAWAFLFVGLVAMSDFEALGDLAAAFAMLILIAVTLGFGPAAFDNVAKLTRGN